ncbi:MAG: glycosyltransferase family 2 protein [Gemmatimonadales bacterium]
MRVDSVRAMSNWEIAAFIALTGVVAVAVGWFGWAWLRLAPRGASLVGYLAASFLVAFATASWLGRWALLWRMRLPRYLEPDPDLRVAVVTTFVAEGEPLPMLEQSVRAMVAIRYPHDTWVLDESDSPEVKKLCERLGALHFSRRTMPQYRTDDGTFQSGSKHGNYNAWLAWVQDRYDIVTAFDPDHVPEVTFLDRVLGYFRDARVGFVQAPQVYYNQRVSLVARGAAEETYDYYSAHQMASYGIGQTILVGSHSTQRMAALRSVGGFAAHDADDLLITVRYRAQGWEGVFVPEILALGLTPVGWYPYLRQQVRWTRSVIDLKLRKLPGLLGRLSPANQFLSLFHGAHYLRPLVLPFGYALLVITILRGSAPSFLALPALAAVAGLAATLGVVGLFRQRFYFDPKREGGVPWRSMLLQLVKWPYQWLAVWRALVGAPAPYALTMKVSAEGRRVVLWPHALVAVGMAAVLAIGFRLHGRLEPSIVALALALIAVSMVIVLAEWVESPPPWAPRVYEDRRAEMADRLGPPQWPSVERRRVQRVRVPA